MTIALEYGTADQQYTDRVPFETILGAYSAEHDDEGNLTIYKYFPYCDYEDEDYGDKVQDGREQDPMPLDASYPAFDADVVREVLDHGTVRPIRVYPKGEWRGVSIAYTDDPDYRRLPAATATSRP